MRPAQAFVFTGIKRMGSARKITKSKDSSDESAPRGNPVACARFVALAMHSRGVDLQAGRFYRVAATSDGAERGFIRVIDDSGEDYLYPQGLFRLYKVATAASETRLLNMRPTEYVPGSGTDDEITPAPSRQRNRKLPSSAR